jgi:hypothetical protein
MVMTYRSDNHEEAYVQQVFQLAFVTRISGAAGLPELDFANQESQCTVYPGTNLLNCPQIGCVTVCEVSLMVRLTKHPHFQRRYQTMSAKRKDHPTFYRRSNINRTWFRFGGGSH